MKIFIPKNKKTTISSRAIKTMKFLSFFGRQQVGNKINI